MLSPDTVYPLLLAWVQALGVAPHATAAPALAVRLTALLLGQSLAPASLARTLLSAADVPARQRFTRVARTWTVRWLTSAWLTPLLVRAVLALVQPTGTLVLALDSVRCGPWEAFTVGLRWHGRVLPLAWAVLPYPWPKGRFTPTVCALLQQLGVAWPADAPRPHLVADRGFPSRPFFQTLHDLGWEFTVRLRARDVVTVAGATQRVKALLAQAVPEQWTVLPATYGGSGRGTAGQLVLGRGLLVLPWHQRDAGSARARQHRAERRAHDVRTKHPRRRTPSTASETDGWVVLFTSVAGWRRPVCTYKQRWAIEGTYRDAQSGWDGRHGWDLEPTLAQQRAAGVVERILGLWALGLLLQYWVGDQAAGADAPPVVQQLVAGWSTTGRLSVFARGRFAFLDQSGYLADWLQRTLQAGVARLRVVPAPAPAPQQEVA